jgi:DNA helicase HerA-like ATPase
MACAEQASELATKYGNVSKASVGTIQRQLLAFESQGADRFFGEPAFEINDFIKCDEQGRGTVNVLAADKLMQSPKLYATFLLWLLSELFEALPEIGDPEKPVLVFFFDEAHLLFDDAPAALFDKVEQVVRLIRSKGVGVYFVTQNPIDIPEKIAGQLGNRVQHALRAFTPEDATALRKTVRTYPKSADYDLSETLTSLGTGEAVVTVLGERGAPTPVAVTMLRAPRSAMTQLDPAEQQQAVAASPLQSRYGVAVDRDSAYERLAARLAPVPAPGPAAGTTTGPRPDEWHEPELGRTGGTPGRPGPAGRGRRPRPAPADEGVLSTVLQSSAFRSFARSAASALGREITRGMFGTRRKR